MNESMWEYELQCARVSVDRAESQEVCTGVADSIVKMFKELLYQVAPRLCALPACVPAPTLTGGSSVLQHGEAGRPTPVPAGASGTLLQLLFSVVSGSLHTCRIYAE